jgi:hypothetical protein
LEKIGKDCPGACYLILPVLTMDTVEGRKIDVPESSFTPDPSPLMLGVMRDGARLINRGRPTAAATLQVPLVRFGDRNGRRPR